MTNILFLTIPYEMKSCLQILIILASFTYILLNIKSINFIKESFESEEIIETVGGHGLRHSERDVVSSMINDYLGNHENAGPDAYLDPITIAKLKRNIIPPGGSFSMESHNKVAYNDVAAYRPGGIHPFNISAEIVSQTLSTSPVANADMFHNNYYDLWEKEKIAEKKLVGEESDKIVNSQKNCIEFKNINQCMSVCAGTADCSGFYLDQKVTNQDGKMQVNNKCCMMVNPPYAANRHDRNRTPTETSMLASRTVNKLIRRAQDTDGKLVFDRIRNDHDGTVYKIDVPRQQCKSMCPKCILGRCPDNYRCVNLNADPRYNYSCLITNEDRYDENKKGYQFDSPDVPHLDSKYQLDEYAAYDPAITPPILSVPESERYYLFDGLIPTNDEYQSAFVEFDENHIGPNTFHPSFNKKYNVEKASTNIDEIGIRGGNDPIGITSTERRGPYYKSNRVVPHS